MQGYITPKGWESFQHYKDRKPAWIKLHRDLLDNLEYHTLSDRAAKCLVLLWLVASEDVDGRIDANPAKLAFRLRISQQDAQSVTRELVSAGFMLEGDESGATHGHKKASAKSVAESNGFGSRHIPDSVKRLVWQRDGGSCRHCGATENIEYDHIHPVSKGGGSTLENIQLLCRPCNRRKRVSACSTDATQAEQSATHEHGSRSPEKEIETEKEIDISPSDLSPADAVDGQQDATRETIPCQAVVDVYNEVCGDLFPAVAKLTDQRRKAIKRAWNADKSNPTERARTNSLDYWRRYFGHCLTITFFRKAASGELSGEHVGWKPDFDFLIREKTWLGVLEGKYE